VAIPPGRSSLGPLYAKDFAEDLLFPSRRSRTSRCPGRSWDIRIWSEGLGLDPKAVAFVSMDSDFPCRESADLPEVCRELF